MDEFLRISNYYPWRVSVHPGCPGAGVAPTGKSKKSRPLDSPKFNGHAQISESVAVLLVEDSIVLSERFGEVL
jgi:hypothetical protein